MQQRQATAISYSTSAAGGRTSGHPRRVSSEGSGEGNVMGFPFVELLLRQSDNINTATGKTHPSSALKLLEQPADHLPGRAQLHGQGLVRDVKRALCGALPQPVSQAFIHATKRHLFN